MSSRKVHSALPFFSRCCVRTGVACRLHFYLPFLARDRAWRALLLEKLSLYTSLLASHPAKAACCSTAGFPDSQSSISMNSWQRPGIFFSFLL